MKKKKLKRREEKEEKKKKRITKRKYPKAIQKRKNRKKLGHMVAPVHFDPKILPKGSAKLRWVWQGQGTPYFIASVVPRKEKSPEFGRPKFDRFILFLKVEL
jgi:hypothetical protein